MTYNKSIFHDLPLILFSNIATLLIIVSTPATFYVAAAFHNAGGWFGWVLTAAMVLALEAGAVGCKLSTAVVPEWRFRLNALTILLLLLTTAANYAYAADVFAQAQLSPTLASVRASWGGWLAIPTLLYAGIVPALLYVFLGLLVQRFLAITKAHDAPVGEQAPEYDEIVRVMLDQGQNASDIQAFFGWTDAKTRYWVQAAFKLPTRLPQRQLPEQQGQEAI